MYSGAIDQRNATAKKGVFDPPSPQYVCRRVCPCAVHRIFQERKNSPKRKFAGWMFHGHLGIILADVPGQNLGQALKTWEKNKHLGVDLHDPKGVQKNFGRTNFQG